MGTCTALCMPLVQVSVRDGAGSLVVISSGSVHVNDGGVQDFVCTNGMPVGADGGTAWGVAGCSGGVLTVSDMPLTSLEVEVVDSTGRRFAGAVPFTLRPTGDEVCRTECLLGTADVTVQ